jgi:hypothetical protein
MSEGLAEVTALMEKWGRDMRPNINITSVIVMWPGSIKIKRTIGEKDGKARTPSNT